LFGCRVTDNGDDNLEIVTYGDRWRHIEKVGREYYEVTNKINKYCIVID